ncbi:hypothetical protein Megvenef_00883 [Candidatus Megaera venefica]|uniref:Uncharacterized protein n=1 Tax=Candidatus Megaera venefica TaxID=2055910 RepID=A0ABU5NCL6_9RICK|nr:cbb3-type cytochrome c oxidase subunit I [Candidatus Megaera venefica]MEA0970914.1 hypothetical protein [Candidatus Megaera venefica]
MISWLKNGVFALAIAGLYSVVLVVLRTPGLGQVFSDPMVFRTALVIHVNLSVLVWLLAITSAVWSVSKIKSGFESVYAKAGFVGMLLMALSPLFPGSEPVMNNYVPMLENLVFIIGLSLFGVVILIFSVQIVVMSFIKQDAFSYGDRIVVITKCTSALLFIGVWVCFILSYFGIDSLTNIVPLEIDYYYEMLFWSGGHLLQFIYTQVMMFALLALAETWKGGRLNYTNVYEMLLALNFVLALFIFIGHFYYDVSDGVFKEFFTLHMIYTGGLAPTIFILALLFELLTARIKNVPPFVSAAFLASSLLFLSGGLIGAIISGVNVTIPAHYHGSIVGISVAFMGLTYLICFKAEIKKTLIHSDGLIGRLYDILENWQGNKSGKVVAWQIYVITFGQLLHVAGLALAGGYGVLRKTPGSDMPFSAKMYMGMVGGGGLIAIIGGLMFVYICAKNLYRSSV